jgi:hypothetical protein
LYFDSRFSNVLTARLDCDSGESSPFEWFGTG